MTTYTSKGKRTTPTITTGKNSFPLGVAVDAKGKIYVNESGNNTLMTYMADGKRSTPTITGLNNPQGVVVDADGKIFVVNYGSNTVTTYTSKGKRTTPTITSGLSGPVGITLH